MRSSAVRPLAVARGGRCRRNGLPGKGPSGGKVRRGRQESLRCVVARESRKLYDALSEKPPRCVVSSQVGSIVWHSPCPKAARPPGGREAPSRGGPVDPMDKPIRVLPQSLYVEPTSGEKRGRGEKGGE